MRACRVEVEVLGGDRTTSSLIILSGLSGSSQGWGALALASLSLSVLALPPSFSYPPGERAPQLASLPRQPAACLRLSSAPTAPCREPPPPSCNSGRGLGGRQLGLRLRGRPSPDVIAHCISIKQSILDMECGADG